MELATIRHGAQARGSQTLEEAFPVVDALIDPLGNQVLVQMRRPKNATASGIILTDDSKDTDETMIRVAIVRAIGPIAYKKRDSMEPWPEGSWVKVGDFVRVPSYAGIDSWRIFIGLRDQIRGGHTEQVPEFVKFAMFNDYDLKGRIKGDPLAVVDYL